MSHSQKQAKLNAITFQWLLLACSTAQVGHCYGAFTQQNAVTDYFCTPLNFYLIIFRYGSRNIEVEENGKAAAMNQDPFN